MENERDAILIGEGVKFERIRRITGYLVGTLERWGNAKQAEEHDRVKHGTMPFWNQPTERSVTHENTD